MLIFVKELSLEYIQRKDMDTMHYLIHRCFSEVYVDEVGFLYAVDIAVMTKECY